MSAKESAGGAKRDVLILGYHGVSESWTSPLSVTPTALEEQLQILHSMGYAGATFADAALGETPRRVFAVTFDDGYKSVGEIARPILDRFGIPATIFVPTQYMDSDRPMSWPGIEEWLGGPHERELMPLSWDELRELAAAGWEIGSHTVSHPHLTTLGDAELHEELVRSREECSSRVGVDCRTIAFPYGDHDERVVEASREAGYSAVATIPWRLKQTEEFVWPRTGVFYGDNRRVFRLKVSPLLRRVRSSRAASPLAPLVHLVRQGPRNLIRRHRERAPKL